MIRIPSIRNFGIIAHIDSGKTTVSERMLYLAGRIHQMGEVHHGTATLDSHPLSRQKGITIQAAVSSVSWKDHVLNLIDTPGHVDFTAEVERSCRVLDGAVAVFCAVGGVQAQSETVWRQAERHGVPRIIFINKIDRAGSDVDRVCTQLAERLDARPILLTYPCHLADGGIGIIDVCTGALLRFGGEDRRGVWREDLPAAERTRWQQVRRALVEAVATEAEGLFEQWSQTGDLDGGAIRSGLRLAVRRGSLHPVLCGSALATIGIQPLLDAVVDLLPDPGEARTVTARDLDGATVPVVVTADGPLRALVFKVACTRHGEVGFCRVYAGTLRSGSTVSCPNQGADERISRLVLLHGDQQQAVPAVGPGQLCAIVGIRHAVTGDTLCTGESVILDGIGFAEPVMGMAVETRTAAERADLAEALSRLAREDPTFRRQVDAETGELVLIGMGELHLEILAHRLEHEHGVAVHLGKPQIAYHQRITTSATARGRYVHQTGGPGAFADVTLRLRPLAAGEMAEDGFRFETDLRGGAVDRRWWPSIADGVRAELARGGKAGVRIQGVHCTLIDGAMHARDSNERAFQAAGALAVREALPDLGCELLEPWMVVEAVCPSDHAGVVIGDLQSRRGQVGAITPLGGGDMAIRAEAPLAELFGYAVALRSLTQGRGQASLEPGQPRPVRQA